MDIIDRDKIMKRRTNNTAKWIKEKLENMSADHLISDLFVTTTDPVAAALVKRYEKQLILANIQYDKFATGLHSFFNETKQYIHENNLYKKFFEFTYFIYSSMSQKASTITDSLGAYQCLLMQQYHYLHKDKLIYGISTSGEFFLIEEVFPYLDFPIFEYRKKYGDNYPTNHQKFYQLMQKYGYGYLKNYEEMITCFKHEQHILNGIYQMAYFIDEHSLDIFPQPYFMPAGGVDNLPRQWKPTDFYMKKLSERKYILSPKGVTAKFKNAGDIMEIFFKEKYMGDRMVMLFRIMFKDGGCSSGFYDTKCQLLYTVWKHGVGHELFHAPVENFVLETYTHLVTDIEIDRKRLFAFRILDDINDKVPYYEQQPIVQFVTSCSNHNKDGTKRLINFDKSNYISFFTDIGPMTRKLPLGARASIEAVERARELGYVISEGETFVRPHKKKVYRSDK